MPHRSDPELLVLHAVRLLGFASDGQVAARYQLARDYVTEECLDQQACGHLTRSSFGAISGWSLTDRGRAAGERALGLELDSCGGRPAIAAVNAAFAPLNARFTAAVTDWQCQPLPGDSLAANDHTDPRWDDRVLAGIAAIGAALRPLVAQLAGVLDRFAGYDTRYAAALQRARAGENRWVAGVGHDSCHVVWMQLHEDLLATLGLDRGQ